MSWLNDVEEILDPQIAEQMKGGDKGNMYFLEGAFFSCSEQNVENILNKLQKEQGCFESLLGDMDGAYTLIFYDEAEKCLYAATDPYGLNKLYFRDHSDLFYISQKLENFFKGSSNPGLDRAGLFEYLRFLDISSPQTCFKNIKILEPGSLLKYTLSNKHIQVVERVFPTKPVGAVDFEMAVSHVNNLLVSGIKKRAQISRKIGLLLSGGVDSSLLASVMAHMGMGGDPEKLEAYTVGFYEDKLDESSIAVRVASHLGIPHQVLKFNIDEEFDVFHEITGRLEVPFADPALIPTVLSLKKMKKDGVNAVMEGTGADGIIGYMPAQYYHRILNYFSRIPQPVRKSISTILRQLNNPGGFLSYFDFEGPEEKFIRWKGWTRGEIETLCDDHCDFFNTSFYKTFRKVRPKGAYELYRKLMICMSDYRISDTCKLYGFLPVFPFFDKEVKNFVEGLPLSFKYHEGENKVLFKKLLEKFVPRDVWDVPKHGFDYPFEKLLLYRDAELIREHLSASHLAEHNLFDSSMVNNYTQRFLSGDQTLKFKIWALVVFQAWYGNYYKRLGHGVIKV